MDVFEENKDVVHPEVRAHINSLVSALGGFSADDEGRYTLGDSATEVLRDIKKWIRFYDEKTNRMDVARCLAEANLIDGDLLHILADWPENATENRFKARVSLACIEIMVPLTWPLERDTTEMTVNHHRHLPVLQLAQLGYMRSIINFDAAQILHTAVRVALPSMAMPRSDRSPRDEGIIKLVLLFLRNIAAINPPPGVKYDGDEAQISRSALIDAFSYQDILLTVLTVASNMGEDFNQEGLIVMEIIFHLVKRVDVPKLFMDDKQLSKARSSELTDMMNKEAAMHRPYNQKAPTRHNRWGTMIWVDRGGGKVSTVSGQDALLDAATRQKKMDAKVYRPPRRARKEELEPKDLGPHVSLNSRARDQLRGFVQDFLDSGFNPLFLHIRKKLDEQRDYVLDHHTRQFFYLVAWFLEAERTRKKTLKNSQPSSTADDIGSFNLVAAVLNQEMFITLNRTMKEAFEGKRWPELCAAMKCFTQILLTVQEMFDSGKEEDEEIAENILSRLFYEEETHDTIASIARGYKDQGFDYLDACTDLTHTYLRVLESYSKQNTDMQVRSRRRVRQKKKVAKAAGEGDDNPAEENDDSDKDEAKAEQVSRERKFDFSRFANRFIPQGVVDTFVAFTKYYQDLNDSQLKRAHRYFYRVAFKQDMSVMLFRVDIIQLFYNMIKGEGALDKGSSTYKEWEELVKQIIKKCTRKIEERPQLIIEMLFSKINATAHYLEFGYEKQTTSTAQTKPGAELEFRHTVELDKQIGIAVGVLLDRNLAHHIKWVKEQLSNAITERKAWAAAEEAMPSVERQDGNDANAEPQETSTVKEPPAISLHPDDDARKTAMFKNSYLRLLMKLVGFERLAPAVDEEPGSAWIIPGPLSADQLQDSIDHIAKAEFDPPTFEAGLLAENQLRRKTAPRKKAVFDDGDDGDAGLDDEQLFAPGGPTARKMIDGEKPKKKKLRRRRRDSDAEPLTEEELAAKEQARRKREKEKARRFKSDLYVHASDDEDDDERWAEFYANEEAIRQRQSKAAMGATAQVEPLLLPKTLKLSTKRKAQVALSDDSDDDNDEDLQLSQGSASSGRAKAVEEPEDGESSASDSDNTPPSSTASSGSKKRRVSKKPTVPAARQDSEIGDTEMVDADNDEDEDEDEDIPAVKSKARRPRTRVGFIADSSDEE